MADRRKDPQDKKAVPSRANSSMDPAEQELWNLGPATGDQSTPPGGEARPEPAAPAASRPVPPPDDADDIDDSGMNEDEDSPSEDVRPRTAGAGGGEKIALGLLAAVLLAGAVWGIATFVSSLPETAPENQIKFPVAGTSVTIAAADTYWRKPDRTRDSGVRLDTRLLPAAVITLAEPTGDGTLRFFFRDQNNDIVGDPSTQVVRNGSFEGSSTNNIEVFCTAGFLDPGDHAAYTTGQIDTWHLEIREGPAPQADGLADGSSFQTIATIPISFNRK